MLTTLLASKITRSCGNASKSAYTELIASTAAQYDGLLITVKKALNTRVLFDIATGAAASETVVIANLYVSRGDANSDSTTTFFVPLRIASGSRLAIRGQSHTSGETITVTVHGTVGGFTSYASCTTYGADTGNTAGTVIDGGATADTEGTIVELTASSGAEHEQLLVVLGPPTSNATAITLVMTDIMTGAGGAESAIINDLLFSNPNGNPNGNQCFFPVFPSTAIPASTRISARCQASTNNANGRTVQIILYAMGSPYSSGGSGLKVPLIGGGLIRV